MKINKIDKRRLYNLVINKYTLLKSDYKGFDFNKVVDFFIKDYIFNELKATSFTSNNKSDLIEIIYQ
jgi:hypothetical protein